MPRKPKRAIDLTTDEVMKRLFPKKVRDELKELADTIAPGKPLKPSSQEKHTTKGD